MPHGEGSSKQFEHSNTISPLETDIDEVFQYFWTVGETVKEVVSAHPEEVEREPDIPRRQVREILIGRIHIPIDGGHPCFNVIPE